MSRQDPRVVEKLESGQWAKPDLYRGPKIFVSPVWLDVVYPSRDLVLVPCVMVVGSGGPFKGGA